MIAHYLLAPELRHGMDYLAETYLHYKPVSIETLIGKKGKDQITMRDAPLEEVKEYAAEDADVANGSVVLTLLSTNTGTCPPVQDQRGLTFANTSFAFAGDDTGGGANAPRGR